MQTYSLQESKLLDPTYNHPSPPTVFAISSNFNLLLSASVSPSTIHLTNLLRNTPPIILHPQCSASAVVTAEFHPERPNVFLLAFADGACATYDAARLYYDGGRGERRREHPNSGATAETMSIKNLHAITNRSSATESESGTERHGFDVGTGVVGIGDKGLGLTAAVFVPGYRRKFVTVGPDGRCCVIDQAGPGKKEACIVNSWNIQGPATSLSITPFQPARGVFGQKDSQAPTKATSALQAKVIIAIGRLDGLVLLFDLNGNQVDEHRFHEDGSRVVDVEWMSGDDSPGMKRSKSGTVGPQTPSAKGKRKSVGSVLARGRLPIEEVISVTNSMDVDLKIPARNSSTKEKGAANAVRQHYLAVTALNHLDIFSPIKPLEPKSTAKKSPRKPDQASDVSEATIKAKRTKSNSQFVDHASSSQPPPIPLTRKSESSQATIKPKRRNSIFQSRNDVPGSLQPPPIPPRPATKIEDYGAASRALTEPLKNGNSACTKGNLNGRNMTAGPSRPKKGLGLFAQYKKPNIIATNPSVINPRLQSSSSKPIGQGATPPETIGEDLWTDILPRPPPQETRAAPRRTSAKRSRSQHQSVSFQSSHSVASNDTVVDWTAASARPPHPILRHPPLESPPKSSKKAKKARICLSPSVASEEDSPVQWSSFKQAPIFRIHDDLLHRPRERGTTSSHPSPMESRDFYLPSMPLAEKTHNPKPPKPSPPVPSSTKPSSTYCATKEDLAQFQTELTQHLHSVMHNDIQVLKDDMTRQFGLQKRWIEVKMDEWRELERRLEDENRGLRSQLASQRRWQIR